MSASSDSKKSSKNRGLYYVKCEIRFVERPSYPPRPLNRAKTNSILLTVKHWENQNEQKGLFSLNVVIMLPNGGLSTIMPHHCRC